MDIRFEAILYSKLGNENYDVVIPNVHAGRIWPEGRRFLTPGSECWLTRVCASIRSKKERIYTLLVHHKRSGGDVSPNFPLDSTLVSNIVLLPYKMR